MCGIDSPDLRVSLLENITKTGAVDGLVLAYLFRHVIQDLVDTTLSMSIIEVKEKI